MKSPISIDVILTVDGMTWQIGIQISKALDTMIAKILI